MNWELLQGDCVEAMRQMDEASVDAIVTDPPYGLEFMGKEWDSLKSGRAAKYAKGGELITAEQIEERRGKGGAGPSYVNRPAKRCKKCGKQAWSGSPCKCEQPEWELDNSPLHAAQEWHAAWATEALRVLKPGGHLLAAGGTRTFHRLVCAIEDAGFEIRDSVIWLYGSGFPKSHNLDGDWEGWGTALKPAHEPIVVARKPLVGTVAANVLEHGTGALNIDGCRIGTDDLSAEYDRQDFAGMGYGGAAEEHEVQNPGKLGRWPANVALSHTEDCVPVGTRKVRGTSARSGGDVSNRPTALEGGERVRTDHLGIPDQETTAWDCSPDCPVAMLDEQSGERGGSGKASGPSLTGESKSVARGQFNGVEDTPFYGDSGGASRFFYTAKASRAERNAGLDGFEEQEIDSGEAPAPMTGNHGQTGKPNKPIRSRNHHPTVKPIDLMRWLVRLVTPPGGIVLDPFTGSGTTGCAAVLEGFDFLGIEREAEYVEIAKARIAWWEQHQGREADEVLAETRRSENLREEYEAAGQMGLEI